MWIPQEYVWAVSTYLPYCYSSSRDYFPSCKSRASRVSDWTAFDNDDAWTKRSYRQPPCHLSLWGEKTNLQRASRYLSDVSGRLKRQQQCCRFPIQVRTLWLSRETTEWRERPRAAPLIASAAKPTEVSLRQIFSGTTNVWTEKVTPWSTLISLAINLWYDFKTLNVYFLGVFQQNYTFIYIM